MAYPLLEVRTNNADEGLLMKRNTLNTLLTTAMVASVACTELPQEQQQIGAAASGAQPGLGDESGSLGRSRSITDGSADLGHPTVGRLQSGSAACSATLIGSRTVLTAAHCIASTRLTFTLGNARYTASAARQHERYGSNSDNDIALVFLDSPVSGVTPSPLNNAPMRVGQPIVLVGFGLTSENGSGYGTKRVATNSVSNVRSETFSFRGQGNVCDGDSGGPTFVTDASSGQEFVAGVHSTKAGYCGYGGTDVRVDSHVAWIVSNAGGDVAAPGSGATPQPTTPPTAPAPPTPTQPAPDTPAVSEGGSCANSPCDRGLACTPVYSGSARELIGRYCMTQCNAIGADPLCNGGETCARSSTADLVCFDGSAPESGFTSPASAAPNSPPATTPPPPEAAPPAYGGACGFNAQEQKVFDLLNQVRSANNQLACDAKAVLVARAYSQDMCDRGFFSHTSPEGAGPSERLRAGGVSFRGWGENIAWGQPTAQAVHDAWMGSSGHRANMLNPGFLRIGIGYVSCGGRPVWTEDFVQ